MNLKKRILLLVALIVVVVGSAVFFFRNSISRNLRLLVNHDLSHANLSGDRQTIRSLALSIHNAHDTRQSFPWSQDITKQMHPELSWRVIPSDFLDQSSSNDVYHHDEPWNSKANLMVRDRLITHFQLSNGNLISRVKSNVDEFSDVSDGAENTIMLIENPHFSGEFWTQPIDLNIPDAIDLIEKIEPGDSLFAATFSGETIRIRSPRLTNISRAQIRAALDPCDGFQFDLANLK